LLASFRVHLVRIEERLLYELDQAVRASVPEKAAARLGRRRLVVVEEVKLRDVAHVEDGRRRASREMPGTAPLRDAEVRAVAARKRARGIVTARAARPFRLRQPLVEEDLLAERDEDRIVGRPRTRRHRQHVRAARGNHRRARELRDARGGERFRRGRLRRGRSRPLAAAHGGEKECGTRCQVPQENGLFRQVPYGMLS